MVCTAKHKEPTLSQALFSFRVLSQFCTAVKSYGSVPLPYMIVMSSLLSQSYFIRCIRFAEWGIIASLLAMHRS